MSDTAPFRRTETKRAGARSQPTNGRFTQAHDAMAKRVSIGIIRNPRSHVNRKRDGGLPTPAGVDWTVQVAEPESRSAIKEAVADFARKGIELLVIDGGDGSVRDVLSAGLEVFGEDWPALVPLPHGKTNALAIDLGLKRTARLEDVVAAWRNESFIQRQPLVVEAVEGSERGHIAAGFIVGAGAFTTGIRAAQDAHRMGAFGGLAVGATVLWGVGQIILGLGQSVWRRGVAMDLRLHPGNRPLPHEGPGSAENRSLVLMTTLERLPLGLRPFGKLRKGLKVLAIDEPHRRVFLSAPLVVAGKRPKWLDRLGLHQTEAEGVDMTIADAFILDGDLHPAGAYRIRKGPRLRFAVPR